jgi:hypothetical protein
MLAEFLQFPFSTQGVLNMSPTDHIGLRIQSLHIVEIRTASGCR